MTERVVEVRLSDGCIALARCDVFEGVVRIAELRLFSRDSEPSAITSRMLQRVSITEIAHRALGEDGQIPDGGSVATFTGLYTGTGARHFLPIAVRYATLVRDAHRRPLRQLARELDLTYVQARDLLVRCRRHGLLTAGRGSVLTEKARALLTEMEGEDASG